MSIVKLILNSKIEPQLLGKITPNVANIIGLEFSNKNIVIWNDRIKYIEKHKSDFETEEEYIKHMEAIPLIISNPDYVGLHPKNHSVQFIKRVEKIMLVGVRLKLKGDLVFRSSYPIAEGKLQTYLESGTIKKVINVDNIE